MSDGWKLDRLLQKVYELECDNRVMTVMLVELKRGLKIGDPVFTWDPIAQVGHSGVITEVMLEMCFIKVEGETLSRQFGYENVSKLTGGDGSNE